MANDLTTIKTELDTDPLVRGYSGMSDKAAADDMNTIYRPGNAAAGALFNYLAKETAKDHSSEVAATHILGRLIRVNDAGKAGVGDETFLTTETPGPFTNLTGAGLDACRTLLAVAEQDRLASLVQVMSETKFVDLLNAVKDAGVMKPADVTAIQALSDNKQSRASELGLSDVTTAEIRWARQIV